MLGFMPLSFPPRKRGPRSRGGAAATERTSAQRVFRRHDAYVRVNTRPPPCRSALSGPMSFWLPARARWALAPGVRRENEGVGKRGPRNRGGAAATKRASAQQVFHRYSVRGSLKTSALPAAESLVIRCPFGCRPVVRGFWLPA